MRLIDSAHARVDTKVIILSEAARLFAESGIDAVSIRDIAIAAKVNAAAVNYHFVSKELLIKAIFRRLFLSMNRVRMEALEACEARANGGRLDAEGIIRALVEPTVRFCMSDDEGGTYFARLLSHSIGLKHNVVEESISEQVDHIMLRFVNALQVALPNIPRAELFWRFDFALGACLRILIDPFRQHRLRRLSGNLCNTDDANVVIEQLVTSIMASMTAPPPKTIRKRTGPKSAPKSKPRTRAAK